MSKEKKHIVVSNRKARYEYHLEEFFTVGIVLTGTEVKSLREGKAALQEAYCYVAGEEVFIKNMTINEYDKGSYNNHDPKRERKLLLRKKEIRRIERHLEEKGYALVPVEVYFSERNFAKMDIALAKGKKLYDKREDIKKKDIERELDRMRF